MERSQRNERGASAVEMAFVAPFLLLLLLGIIEFGYVFGEYNEIRHGAREGARIAAVSNVAFDQAPNDGVFDEDDIKTYVCNTLQLPGAATVELVATDLDGNGTIGIGDSAVVTVEAVGGSLTGAPLISSFVPTSLSNSATFVIEQPATWSNISPASSC